MLEGLAYCFHQQCDFRIQLAVLFDTLEAYLLKRLELGREMLNCHLVRVRP